MHPLHCDVEIAALAGFGPIGGIDTGLTIEIEDLEPAIVSQRRKPGRRDGGAGLDPGIADKALLRLFGFGQAVIGIARHRDAIGRQQRAKFIELARIMRSHDEGGLGKAAHHAIAASCARPSSAHPASARSSSWVICSRVKVEPSADICTSIRRDPDITKLPSTPASLSSG